MTDDDSIATRASLLGRLKDREDQASWQEFFDTYWQLIYRVAADVKSAQFSRKTSSFRADYAENEIRVLG